MAASYAPVDTSMRLSLKVHNATPAQLQANMHSQLNCMLGAAGAAVESGFMRPGCVHLVLQVRAPLAAPHQSVTEAVPRHALAAAAGSAAADALSGVVARLDGSDWAQALTGGSEQLSLTLQLPNDQAVLLRNGTVTRTVNLQHEQPEQQPASIDDEGASCSSAAAAAAATSSSTHMLCRLDGIVPGCISSTNLAADGCASLLAIGMGLARQGTCVLARMQGMFLPAETRVQPYSRRSFDARDAVVADCVGVQLQLLQPYGLVHVEFQQGLLLSQAKPLLVVDSAEVASEIQGMLQCVQQQPSDDTTSGSSSSMMSQLEAEHMLVDFGRLLDFRAVFERHRSSSGAQQAADNAEDTDLPTAAAAAASAETAEAAAARQQQRASSRAATAVTAAAWQWEQRHRDIDDSAHEGLPFVASAAAPWPAATSGTAATSSNAITASSSRSTAAAAREIEPAHDAGSTAAAVLSGASVAARSRLFISGSSSEHPLPPLASAAPATSRRSALRSLASLSLSGGGSGATRAAAKPPAAPTAAAAPASNSSSGFGSAAAAATRRLKERLSFAQLVRNRSFSFGRHSAAAAADALVPPRHDSGGSFSIFGSSADNRRSQSLDLGGSRTPFLAALRSRSFRLGGSGPSFRSGGSASPALRRSFDGPPPVETSSLSNSSSSSVAQVLQQRRRQWQEQQQQLARELRGTPEAAEVEEDSVVDASSAQQPQQQQMGAVAVGSSTADGDAETVADDDDSAFCVAVAASSGQQQRATQQQQQAHVQEQQEEVAEEAEDEDDLRLPLPTQHPLLGPEYIGCMM
jgi:hypothetical protein